MVARCYIWVIVSIMLGTAAAFRAEEAGTVPLRDLASAVGMQIGTAVSSSVEYLSPRR